MAITFLGELELARAGMSARDEKAQQQVAEIVRLADEAQQQQHKLDLLSELGVRANATDDELVHPHPPSPTKNALESSELNMYLHACVHVRVHVRTHGETERKHTFLRRCR